jgi:hypothetical protein
MRHALVGQRVALAMTLAMVLTSVPALAAPPGPAPRPERGSGDRMVQAGVGVVVSGLVGYGLMAVGLNVGNRAEGELLPLTSREDIEARREVLARGRLGNRLAIAGAVTAAVAMAVGIPLIVIGRRRHEASMPRATVIVGGMGPGVGLRLRGRF